MIPALLVVLFSTLAFIIWKLYKVSFAVVALGVDAKDVDQRRGAVVETVAKSAVSAICKTLSADLRAAIVANGAVLNRHADERHADVTKLHQAHGTRINELSEHVSSAHKCAGDDRIRFIDSVNAITKLLRPEDFPKGRYVERNSDV